MTLTDDVTDPTEADGCAPLVLVEDPASADGVMQAGEVWTWDCTTVANSFAVNEAEVTGYDLEGNPVSDPATATVDVFVSEINLRKTRPGPRSRGRLDHLHVHRHQPEHGTALQHHPHRRPVHVDHLRRRRHQR